MDFVQDYITLLPRFLPPSVANPLLTLVTTLFGIMRALQTQFSPLIARIITQPDVASILALLAILFISLKILDMAYRAVIFWVKLVVKVVFSVAVLGVGFWMWNRGLDGFVEDLQGLAEYYMREYERFKGEANGWQMQEEAKVRFQAGQPRARARARAGRSW
ncbi:hypothetical protein K458DRAFT_474066 [Lentithecium fluviatile CBS 122367]|uniref:Nuclear pore assembly and biogenesis-domain-containing protein n=1 Tax=Lentithecium fluviatile CBS 122367 TaxID=1168545 RepID=A0A6G1JKJ2_9PLEO|nr:hypothetical protein K458DRAFT_474066 [Lentithecium fluviatile CBS 122367]